MALVVGSPDLVAWGVSLMGDALAMWVEAPEELREAIELAVPNPQGDDRPQNQENALKETVAAIIDVEEADPEATAMIDKLQIFLLDLNTLAGNQIATLIAEERASR